MTPPHSPPFQWSSYTFLEKRLNDSNSPHCVCFNPPFIHLPYKRIAKLSLRKVPCIIEGRLTEGQAKRRTRHREHEDPHVPSCFLRSWAPGKRGRINWAADFVPLYDTLISRNTIIISLTCGRPLKRVLIKFSGAASFDARSENSGTWVKHFILIDKLKQLPKRLFCCFRLDQQKIQIAISSNWHYWFHCMQVYMWI